jgi:hypothetical protein
MVGEVGVWGGVMSWGGIGGGRIYYDQYRFND